MTTSRVSAMAAGFEQAVKAYFDEAIKAATPGRGKRTLEKQRSDMLTSNPGMSQKLGINRGMSDMLVILDDQESDYLMSKGIALFYVGWSPDVWEDRSEHPLYPYKDNQKHATKGAIDQWVLACIEMKHTQLFGAMQSPDWGREPNSGRPYIVDMETGSVICDGIISGIEKRHSTALGKSDIEIRYHTFTEALTLPWRDDAMRKVWARSYRRYLVAMTRLAERELAAFDTAEDKAVLRLRTPKARGKSEPRRP